MGADRDGWLWADDFILILCIHLPLTCLQDTGPKHSVKFQPFSSHHHHRLGSRGHQPLWFHLGCSVEFYFLYKMSSCWALWSWKPLCEGIHDFTLLGTKQTIFPSLFPMFRACALGSISDNSCWGPSSSASAAALCPIVAFAAECQKPRRGVFGGLASRDLKNVINIVEPKQTQCPKQTKTIFGLASKFPALCVQTEIGFMCFDLKESIFGQQRCKRDLSLPPGVRHPGFSSAPPEKNSGSATAPIFVWIGPTARDALRDLSAFSTTRRQTLYLYQAVCLDHQVCVWFPDMESVTEPDGTEGFLVPWP